MEEVQQQKVLPTIRSYLKLYTTMPLDKMAGFMELQPEDFRDNLLAFKHKMKNVVWTRGTSGQYSRIYESLRSILSIELCRS